MDPVILRAIERIIAVVIGGVCIWLGQRLFLQIPEQKAGEGKIQFPGGISVYVARVGPGVFFALFGATLVAVSFYRGIEVQSSRLGAAAAVAGAAAVPRNVTAPYGFARVVPATPPVVAVVCAAAGAARISENRNAVESGLATKPSNAVLLCSGLLTRRMIPTNSSYQDLVRVSTHLDGRYGARRRRGWPGRARL